MPNIHTEGERLLERIVGTTVRGLRGPIINQGDDLETLIVDTVLVPLKWKNLKSKIVTLSQLQNQSLPAHKETTQPLTTSRPMLLREIW